MGLSRRKSFSKETPVPASGEPRFTTENVPASLRTILLHKVHSEGEAPRTKPQDQLVGVPPSPGVGPCCSGDRQASHPSRPSHWAPSPLASGGRLGRAHTRLRAETLLRRGARSLPKADPSGGSPSQPRFLPKLPRGWWAKPARTPFAYRGRGTAHTPRLSEKTRSPGRV